MNSTAFYAAELCRLYVLLLLLFAAAGKAVRSEAFEASFRALLGTGPRGSRVGAVGIIAAEAGIVPLLLAGGGWATAGMAAALLLFALFSVAIGAALAQGRRISCNCFGGGTHRISVFDLTRNGAVIAAGAFYLLHAPEAQGSSPYGWALLAGAALILVVISINLGEVAALVR